LRPKEKVPKAGDLVNVLVQTRNPQTWDIEHIWKSGILLEWPKSISFDNNLWVDVLVNGEKIKSSPTQIELL